MSPSPGCGKFDGHRPRRAERRRRWRRSPGAPGAACATARSAPPPTARRCRRRSPRRWRRIVSSRWSSCAGATARSISPMWMRCWPRLLAPPPGPGLVRGNDATDLETLAALAREPEMRELARGRARVRLLWEACQIPDFRKLADDSHVRLCGRVFGHVVRDGRLPTDWLAGADRRARPRRRRYRHADAAAAGRAGVVLHRRPRRLGARTRRTGRAARARSRTGCRTRCTSG